MLKVVSERAASLGLVQETRYGLEANHQEMTKFQDSKCLGYVIFLRFLREQITRKGIRSISVPISTIASEQEIQRSILHTKREDDVLEANTLLSPMGTCCNLLDVYTLSERQTKKCLFYPS